MANATPAVNPYAKPNAAVAEAAEQYQEVRIFSVSGRIGRARYFTYSLGMYILFSLLVGALSALIGRFASVVFLAWIVIGFMLTIQRCHDFNTTGWLSILGLIPVVNLIFLFIPGTDGPNRFGPRTPPNTLLTLVLVWIFPLLVVAILAAVAIPAYQQHAARAKQMQQQQQAPKR